MHLKLENRQIAVFAVLIIAVIMLFLPGQDKKRFSFNPEVLAGTIEEGKDQVSPFELSKWIIAGKNDFKLVDIRSELEYKSGHIKGAVGIPMSRLLKRSTIDSEFADGKMVIVYSNGSSHAAQVWMVLKSAGVEAYVLEGGYNFWNETVLNPKEPLPGSSDDEVLKYQALKSVADHFGAGTKPQQAVDKQPNKPSPKAAPSGGKKKKLQGC
jgi:rhodanese-related sulfurtransferase